MIASIAPKAFFFGHKPQKDEPPTTPAAYTSLVDKRLQDLLAMRDDHMLTETASNEQILRALRAPRIAKWSSSTIANNWCMASARGVPFFSFSWVTLYLLASRRFPDLCIYDANLTDELSAHQYLSDIGFAPQHLCDRVS